MLDEWRLGSTFRPVGGAFTHSFGEIHLGKKTNNQSVKFADNYTSVYAQ